MDVARLYLTAVCLIILGFFLVLVVIPKFFSKKCLSKICLVGKTAVVTGGSLGIGYEIVLGLAQRGCKVIIADKIISNDIKNKIMTETNNPEIYMEFVDLGSFNSVRAFAEKLKSREEKIDILIHNAGIGFCNGSMTVDGLNLTMQVNYYSPFLLTHLLLDLLKNSSSARLLFCSSPIVSVFADLICFGKTVKKTFGDYRISKFCVLVIADMFAKKLKCHGITSNSFHPGGVNTQIHKQFCRHRFLKYLHDVFGSWVFKTPEDGAQTAIYLSCANEVQNVSGRFFADLAPICKPKQLDNQEMCETIWESSEKVVKLKKEELL